jgi:hypothetical protein
MDNSSLNDRAICTLRGKSPQEDLNLVADAVIAAGGIINFQGRLIWLKDGKLVPVTEGVLHEFISTRVVSMQLINRGTTDNPNWTLEYPPFRPPTERALRTMLTAETKEQGSLFARAPIVS